MAIGTVTFNEKTHARTWKFACGPQEASESLDEYIDRGVRMGGWGAEGGPKREDYRDFANWVIDAYADVGLECLVIWESEIKNDPVEVRARVAAFVASTR